MDLRALLENTNTKAGKYFDICIQCLILVSICSFSVETLPNLSPTTRLVLEVIEVVCVAVFTLEYVLRLAFAERKLRFVFSFLGLIDLLAIAPFYISRVIDLRAIRIVRLFRLFRIFKFFRYSKAIDHFRKAFADIREELILFMIATVVMVYLASVGIYYFEHEAQPEFFASVFHSMWWAVVTLTTVGYGDVFPITIGGKIFTGLLLLIGVGVISIPSGLFAAALTKNK